MRIFVNKENRHFFLTVMSVMAGFMLLQAVILGQTAGALQMEVSLQGTELLTFSLLILLFLVTLCCISAACVRYFNRQDKLLETAVSQIDKFLSGDTDARIDCDQEGELYKLFHAVNTLSSVLNAHAANELQEKVFLKNTISDISHQLKTPLAALNVYNGLLQEETKENPELQEFVRLSEKELDRIETLVQNLLKITRLDSGFVVFEKHMENVADMMKDIELHFAYRAKQEQKEVILSGSEEVSLLCDRDWMTEAMENIVKNAFDHTRMGNTISIKWQQSASAVRIEIKDNGLGIHPEDLPHIFKRFYRSRFSKNSSETIKTQGIGLGLPLAKAIIEGHGGTVEVDSEPGVGSAFVLNFLIPTKL